MFAHTNLKFAQIRFIHVVSIKNIWLHKYVRLDKNKFRPLQDLFVRKFEKVELSGAKERVNQIQVRNFRGAFLEQKQLVQDTYVNIYNVS